MKRIGTLLLIFIVLGFADTLSVQIGQVTIIQKDNNRRLLMRFDISAIPESSRVRYAQIYAPFNLIDTFDIDARKITTNWERRNVTWNYPWRNPGGDFDTTMLGLFSYRYGLHHAFSLDITKIVQDWVNGTSNYGIIFKPAFTRNIGFIRVQRIIQGLSNARIRIFYYQKQSVDKESQKKGIQR